MWVNQRGEIVKKRQTQSSRSHHLPTALHMKRVGSFCKLSYNMKRLTNSEDNTITITTYQRGHVESQCGSSKTQKYGFVSEAFFKVLKTFVSKYRETALY